MEKVFVLILLFFNANLFAQNTLAPKGFEILTQKDGDLDKDGINEKVIVYNTTDTTDDGTVREIQIFKRNNDRWNLWKRSVNAILKSREGGMMRDPFEEIDIKQGLLIIKQGGGSSWKWEYADKYRFQNGDFVLIGYSGVFGKPCEYWENVDFNLMRGKIIYKKEFEDCDKGQEIYKTENETFFKKGILINLNNRYLKEYKIVSPKYKHELYL